MGQGGHGGGPVSVSVEATDPAGPLDGQIWIRSTDLQRFTYSDSLGKWLGELVEWEFGHQNVTYAGFLQTNPRILSDTTTGAELGYYADGTMRLMEAHLRASNAADNTTQVWTNQTLAVKLLWSGNTTVCTPTVDSTNGWVAPAERVVFAESTLVAANNITSSGTDASLPHVKLYVREEVTP
jgi:hypothetical protein